MLHHESTHLEPVSSGVLHNRITPLFDPPNALSQSSVEFIPGPIMSKGFHAQVITAIEGGFPNTDLKNGIIGGYSYDELREHCLQHGRADFTKTWPGLPGRLGINPYGMSLLYGFFHMRRHYFEMRHLLHRQHDFLVETVFHQTRPLLIDLGCGPWTVGIATLDSFEGFRRGVTLECIGFERAQEMVALGNRIMATARTGDNFAHGKDWNDPVSREDVYRRIRSFNRDGTIWITASYLFASQTLDAEKLGEFVDGIVRAAGDRNVCFLETNTTNTTIGNKFHAFVNATPSLHGLFGGTTTVNYFTSQAAKDFVTREYDEYTGEVCESSALPTSVGFRYMFLGNEKLACECITSLNERGR